MGFKVQGAGFGVGLGWGLKVSGSGFRVREITRGTYRWCPTPADCLSCLTPDSCRANSAHIRQSRPNSGLGLSHFSGERPQNL